MMTRRRLAALVAAAGLLAAPRVAAGQAEPALGVIRGIEVTSSWEALVPAARAAITLAAGDHYDVTTMQRTLQNLYALGTIADIRVTATQSAQGTVLHFALEPQVRMWDVRFTGAPPWRGGKLRNALSLREGDILDQAAASTQANRLQQALADDGYLLATVQGTVATEDNPARGFLVLDITPGTRATLGRISVHGDGGIADSNLAAALALRTGGPYRPPVFEAALERLRARLLRSNFFFHETRVTEQSLDLRSNEMSLEIEVTVGPRVALDLAGLPFEPTDMRQRLAVFEFGTVDDWALKDTRHEIVRWLQERGYWRPLVSYSRGRDELGRNTNVQFRVLEGQRATLRSIDFTGNDSIDDETLRAAIRSRAAALLAPRRFISDWWEEDQRAVQAIYRRRGFGDVRIVAATADFDEEHGGVVATMVIEEGTRRTVNHVEVTVEGAGTEGLKAALWQGALEQVEGGPFSPAAVRRDADRLRAILAGAGYPRAIVTSSLEPAGSTDEMTVAHRVAPGDRQFVSRVLVAGNDSTNTNVIRRELAFSVGDPFSFADLLDTQSRLYATGLFSQVDVAPTLADDLSEQQPLVVRVQEAPPVFITYGAGYDTEEKVRGIFTIGHNNIAGRNQELSFSTRASVREQRFRVLFREPYFMGRRTEGTATAFYTNEQQASFKTQRYGLSFQLLLQHSDSLASLPRLVFRDTTTFDVEIDPAFLRPEDQSTRVGALSYSFILDTRPNPVDPTSGFYGTSDIEVASRILGSNTNFTTFNARWFGYRGVSERLTLALALRAGIKIPYSGSSSIPLPERFFAGGSTTLRGFSLDGAGPVDENGNPLGGRVLLIGNIEMRARLWGEFGAVVFADIGNVFALPATVEWRQVRETLGIGVRYATPVGPIRFDLARLLDQRPGEDRYQIFFSIGHTF
jgi:outer membrane protein insertion porin family